MKTKKEVERIVEANNYIKQNLLKRILKYKLWELIIIPIIVLAIWKIPYWIGFGIKQLFNLSDVCMGEPCTAGQIWGMGSLVLVILGFFIWINYTFVKSKLEREAVKKFNVQWYDLK